MSTNYYYQYGDCKDCGRFERLHIGKLSVGWKFLFSVFDGHIVLGDPDISQLTLKSYKAWEHFIRSRKWKGNIYNEYGKGLEYTQFFKNIVNKNQHLKSHIDTKGFPLHIQKDIQGYEFSRSEFC